MISFIYIHILVQYYTIFRENVYATLENKQNLEEGLDFDAGRVLLRESALRLLNLSAQLLHGADVLPDVFTLLPIEQLNEVVHHALVEVLAAEMRVALRREHLEHCCRSSAASRRACRRPNRTPLCSSRPPCRDRKRWPRRTAR